MTTKDDYKTLVGQNGQWNSASPTFERILQRSDLLMRHVSSIGSSWSPIPARSGTRPRNPRFPIARFDIQTAFRARMNILKSGISGSVWNRVENRLAYRTDGLGCTHTRPKVAPRPRNQRFKIYKFRPVTAFRARMIVFKSGISGYGCTCPFWGTLSKSIVSWHDS
jgi:hypothetical protein